MVSRSVFHAGLQCFFDCFSLLTTGDVNKAFIRMWLTARHGQNHKKTFMSWSSAYGHPLPIMQFWPLLKAEIYSEF